MLFRANSPSAIAANTNSVSSKARSLRITNHSTGRQQRPAVYGQRTDRPDALGQSRDRPDAVEAIADKNLIGLQQFRVADIALADWQRKAGGAP